MTRKEILEKTIDFDDAINRIVRLEKENAELKEELTKKADTNHSLVEQMADLENENAENESEARELNIRIDGLIKENAELKNRNAELKGMYAHSAREAGTYKQFLELKEKENAELRKVAEFQQSSNMSRHFENKKLKEGLAVGSTFNKALNSMNKNLEEERDKYRNMVFDKDEQLTKAKELLERLLITSCNSDVLNLLPNCSEVLRVRVEAEQFLNEVEK